MRRLLCWLGWHVFPYSFDPRRPDKWACIHCRKPWMEW